MAWRCPLGADGWSGVLDSWLRWPSHGPTPTTRLLPLPILMLVLPVSSDTPLLRPAADPVQNNEQVCLSEAKSCAAGA